MAQKNISQFDKKKRFSYNATIEDKKILRVVEMYFHLRAHSTFWRREETGENVLKGCARRTTKNIYSSLSLSTIGYLESSEIKMLPHSCERCMAQKKDLPPASTTLAAAIPNKDQSSIA